MRKVTVVQINNQFFLPTTNGLKELDFAILNAWWEEGMEVEVEEVESVV